jgi:hypothetical protein
MTKEQAEQLIRQMLAQINLPLAKHQELQAAVTVLTKGENTEVTKK